MGRYCWVPSTEGRGADESLPEVRDTDRALDAALFLREKRFPIGVVLDNIRSAYNVGSIFRTADAARVEKLYLCGVTAYPPNDKLEKTALGAVDFVPWEYHGQTLALVRHLKDEGAAIVSLETAAGSICHFQYRFPKPVFLVVGNEVDGVSREVLRLSDAIVEVPVWGMKNSINVAALFGIVIYELLRQFGTAPDGAPLGELR
ncbi:MAG: RNA methyltransferase [Candidatus Eremiobacteraeota bacterium]|nr:RNA methyltransferase [Candidatus Eremiobacteraeota bacterium]